VGGGEYSFLDLMKNLPPVWQPIAVVPEEGVLKELLNKASIKPFITPLSTIRPWTLHKILKSISNLIALTKKTKPDLIYANGPRAAFYSCVTKPFHRLPVIWHCRIADRDVKMDWLLYRLSSLIIANSHATANRFKNFSQNKLKVIYNGIDIQWLQDEAIKKPDLIQPDWKVILVVARISRWKRHDLALSAFEKIAPTDPKFHLVCVGAKDELEPRWYDYLMRKTGQSRFSDRIHWIGQVEDVRPWYKSAHILLLPSENEPFGRVLVEAMACGVPVIATRSGGVPEIVRDGIDGILVTSGDADALVKAVLRILRDESLRTHISKTTKKRAENFNLSTHVENMMEVFRHITRHNTQKPTSN